MKERPILFSGPMVRAILEGRKTQTRRVVKPQPGCDPRDDEHLDMGRCPYGQPGDRLWVREAWHTDERDLEYARAKHEDAMSDSPIYYRADPENDNAGCTWRPSIHMPRWASRITLEITRVRVERLQEISEKDAIAEGADPYLHPVHPGREGLRHVDGFRSLWESINGPGSWDANPWVWVIEFKRVEG